MPDFVESTLRHLLTVDEERVRRLAIAGLAAKVTALKIFQQLRFSRTYADLLGSPRYGPAARFFLDELYGPTDFSERDAQFARVAPTVVRLFPHDVSETVAILAELHSLSESLDTEMALRLREASFNAFEYVLAWQGIGRAEDRLTQVKLTLEIAARLDRLTHKPLLRHSLRMMRGPARASGLGELQRFLETGFDTFRAMGGTDDFISLIKSREAAFASAMFNAQMSLGSLHASVRLALASLPAV